jgi:hypothetical protein
MQLKWIVQIRLPLGRWQPKETYYWQFGEQHEYTSCKVDPKEEIVVFHVVSRYKESIKIPSKPWSFTIITAQTYKKMGTLVNHFFDGVY